ncbi:YbfB/YjiJ family MFS transporter [Luteibacter aegosomatissinici]|uniref:YbfB/YjiJ family MFS transporter n=1 Tax=Luteibacter aegosomatissinici TaxID=2911539 RepID=UPI001FF97980|nr:YbfB/YjiJ family MFS transporter [Luteibacter aegosomatissinici]UPG94539.1 YbfB/YjiJ family MFS transporter [Luteibacter aegosomatissinici]
MMSIKEPRAAFPAALALVVGMGIGRFAFTGLYPQMVQEGLMTVSAGSLAASANNAGYLIGAVFAGMFPSIGARHKCTAALVATVIFCLALAMPLGPVMLILVRAGAGLASAVAMVAASFWLLHDQGDTHSAPLLYAGVGVGTALSAEVIAAGRSLGLHSGLIWLVITSMSIVLTIISVVLMGRSHRRHGLSRTTIAATWIDAVPLTVRKLALLYMLAGFGGSITATYLPLFVRGALGAVNPVHVWALFGVAAIPSSFLWHSLHVRLGTRYALSINLLVQGIGVGLPALFASAATYAISAVLVGGAFMGTVTIVLPAARRVSHQVRYNVMALMSTAYGSGLIVGPLVADAFFAKHHDFSISLLVASGALIVASGYASMRRRVDRHDQDTNLQTDT